ncbi:SPX domain-domain-containing protein [Naematelia encephala]|uniref:SPX domain-domain-containing protein n=1 Tax=Naematelia encephala TaxID=71784 RepID=A0A1Y2BLF5_9TREE|nr:SPX domain-domain-containing protein [Naematelia encephala]
MKFGTLLELNSNIEWWTHYVDYGALKKLFPSTPLDATYLSTHQHGENASLLPQYHDSSKWATPEEFRAALEKERSKVIEFYKAKLEDLQTAYDQIDGEIRGMEDQDLATDDVIKEEDEDQEENEDGGEADALISSQNLPATRPTMKSRESFMNRLKPFGRKRRGAHEVDILEASFAPNLRQVRSRSESRNGGSSLADSQDREGSMSPYRGRVHRSSRGRRSSDLDSDEGVLQHERRTSISSNSSHGDIASWSRARVHSLGLVPMDPNAIPSWAKEGVDEQAPGRPRPIYVWTDKSDYGMVSRISFKKRLSDLWVEAYALKQYVDLNLQAFGKILKKYDKNTNSKLKQDYLNKVMQSYPWLPESKEELDLLLARVLFLYRRVAAQGDEETAKDQLRSQLREKVVVDRETVWTQMVSGRRSGQGIFRSVEPEVDDSMFEKDSMRRAAWLSRKSLIFVAAVVTLVVIVMVKPLPGREESNCLAMLLFCTLLWMTEAIPLFVTSMTVPFLVVVLRIIRTADGSDAMSAADATKYIFSQMFNSTIMLLIGGFTIAAVLSKTRLDVMTASRILNAAGTKPSVVLLVLMFVATFASMWISNVAAPTLCYALVKPILDELQPKSIFSKCLVIAIALASNIGGQASPISSPQNLIALGSMDPPLSWAEWFAISIPVSGISVLGIWAFLHLMYRWEPDLSIPKMRKNTDSLTKTHYYVLVVTLFTIALWCIEKNVEGTVGDMGVIALIPIVAFFGTSILSKEDFHSFHWSIVFLAMGGIALGKATLSSGLLDRLDSVLEHFVEGMGLFRILLVFSLLALVVATFISHTIAAVLLVPIATRIGDSLDEPHPRLLIMATALICSAGMGLPVSGFPNMTAINQENKLGQRYIGPQDFLRSGIVSSVLATFVIVTIGYAIMRGLGL